ncbi:MAG: hypothetical protein K2L38_13365, partial [Dysosmobacter sp.]|nr:hypothetical protein [Dysosmobacter sp.]
SLIVGSVRCVYQTVLGPSGHLRNEDAAAFAVALARAGAREIVLAHLSRENNTPAMALRAVEAALRAAGLSPRLSAAPRDCLSGAYVLRGGAPCSESPCSASGS